MKFEQYLREKDILHDFLKEYSLGEILFIGYDELTYITCASEKTCESCSLISNCKLGSIGENYITVDEYNKHFTSLLEEYKKTNPEEFI